MRPSKLVAFVLFAACSNPAPGTEAPDASPEESTQVDIIRDDRGVPHVHAETLAGAFYGLGYATAEDRLYQMDFARRSMRGRRAETFGPGPGRIHVTHDRQMRILGFGRHADAVAGSLPADVAPLLAAYADGVNAYLRSEGFRLPPAFAAAGLDAIDDWTAADSLLVLDYIAYLFSGPNMDAEIARGIECRDGCPEPDPACNPGVDEDAAVVPAPAGATASGAGLGPSEVLFKASHGWVVSGERTTTGAPLLHSDPQLTVTSPSPLYESHISAQGLSARGIGFAGVPGHMIGWTGHHAVGVTAAGGDVTDLFELTLVGDGAHYLLDGEERAFDTRVETLVIKGEAAETLEVRESYFGPVVTPLLSAPPPGREYALRHVELMRTDSHSVVGMIRMMRATSLAEYREALEEWRTPGVNGLYADVNGNIAYHVLIGIPKRATDLNPEPGRIPFDGSDSSQDWGAMLSADERPHVINPPAGVIFSANHLSVGGWFPYYTGLGGVGDTGRSFRLRAIFDEALADPEARLSPADVLAIHSDTKLEAVRVLLAALTHLDARGALAGGPATPAGKARLALESLRQWGGEAVVDDERTGLALLLQGTAAGRFRFQHHPEMACVWNAGGGGMNRWLKALDADMERILTAGSDDEAFLIAAAAEAWDASLSWNFSGDFTVLYQPNFFCATGPGACSLDPSQDYEIDLFAPSPATLLSQSGNTYSQFVDFSALESSRAMLAPGVSEDPNSDRAYTGLELWQAGELGPAPRDRATVEATATASYSLPYP